MAKGKPVYICNECGFESPKWNGRCPSCGAWNSFEEQLPAPSAVMGGGIRQAAACLSLAEIGTKAEVRCKTNVEELDRVLGGGIVRGSLILLGGDPGIGKSTLLLQICEYLKNDLNILYVSGEESGRQLKLRAERLGVTSDSLSILTANDMDAIIATIEQTKPELVMIDSIQTMSLSGISSTAGSITQVRECTNLLMRLAKSMDISIMLVGHVNKDGAIAGPKVLEHAVDVVLYFEGDRNFSYRILRAVKNRYGSTNEIGVFEMKNSGLEQVPNPSQMLLDGRPQGVSGTCAACVMEGSRPLILEVQALVTKTSFGNPRRMATGFDYNRAALLLAVLEKRAGYFFGAMDAYVNVVGGFKLDDPSADLSVALSLVSSLCDRPVPDDLLAFGEIGLAGEIRPVSHLEQRLREAKRLGFTRCLIPRQMSRSVEDIGLRLIPVSYLKQAIAALEQ